MTLGDIIINCEAHKEFSFVYAKRKKEKFSANSEAIVLVLVDNELDTNTSEIARQKCPGYDYFLEVFIIQEMFRELKELDEYKQNEKLIERIIYYAENDA